MNKIPSGVVFVCIFALTHHSGITASASDLSPAQMAAGKAAAAAADTPTTLSGVGAAGAGANKATDLFAIENEDASTVDDSIMPSLMADAQSTGGGKRRPTRSFFFSFPYDGLYSNLYSNYGGYNPYYSTYYPTAYKFLGGGYNPYYYGYPRVIWG